MHDRWDPNSTKGLKGARSIIAWTKKPDDTLPRSRQVRPLYAILNRLPYGKLNGYLKKDRCGELDEGSDDEDTPAH